MCTGKYKAALPCLSMKGRLTPRGGGGRLAVSATAACTLLLAVCMQRGVTAAADGLPKAVIFDVEPRRGSLMGGTRLVLKGSGFSRGGLEGCVSLHAKRQPILDSAPGLALAQEHNCAAGKHTLHCVRV